MKSSNPQIFEQLNQLLADFIVQHKAKYQCLPQVQFEPEWLSPCQQGEVNDEYIHWQPIKVDDPLTFTNVAQALEITLHDDFSTYYSCFYSESIPVHCSEGYLELLFAWNKDDFERLQQNVIGHVLMKQKLKQPITLFFAVTDEHDHIISMINDTREIWVEKVGCLPHKKLANSLSEFIASLTIAL